MRIEPVTPDTLPLLEEGLRALAVDLGDPYEVTTQTLTEALFGPAPACHGLLACEGDALRGITLYSLTMSTRWGGSGAYISDLWVAAQARGAGVGQRLMGAVAARHEARFLRLMVYADNPRASALYTRLGFQATEDETLLQLTGSAFSDLERL